jgi:predicted RNase H-like HicB family nuclease
LQGWERFALNICFYISANTICLGERVNKEFSAVVTKGEAAFVALCPELGVVSQGDTESRALDNLKEAVELYLEDEDAQKMLKKKPVKKAKICSISVSA